MSIIIDNLAALNVLREEERLARMGKGIDKDWAERVKSLRQSCEGKSKTMIAMLGTALLAKATDLRADVFALKSSAGTEGAYSARRLCKDVLAANAPALNIDLGVTGREPLNNQPFFGKMRVAKGMNVHRASQPRLDELIAHLEVAGKLPTKEAARIALRSFLYVQKRTRKIHPVGDMDGDVLSPEQCTMHIGMFVAQDSESGNRAQAVTAGILEVLAPNKVMVSRIHDPDRRFPGDVVICNGETDEIEKSFEVRDKPVSLADIQHAVQKGVKCGVHRIGILAIAAKQEALPVEEACRWAWDEHRAVLEVFTSWESFFQGVAFWSSCTTSHLPGQAFRTVAQYLDKLEVSPEGIDLWMSVLESE